MGLQQTRSSKRKCRQRRAANRYKGFQLRPCPQCGNLSLPHRVCRSCGHYKGRRIVSTTTES